ncbi:2,3-dimethylmalate dehydratase small subunit [Clostridium sp. N3C]|uniref:LeuD/DmdB family oxidoreductase small subunit n=1 Tax=Clostridium sp. N3C TaxID=1776758 RepID=UPI00092E094D|nr:3-isopropylmalate dehydratase small subunit [Clostridium sp. N3C]NLZ35559.1 3-isopropylmalate dehydratase small subunit [Clostridiales bacterium]SCN25778.1 2,3-dimethylmalate dehydratase small subunit [Clostridium sp. N3C]
MIKGKAIKFGNNIDTDQIIGGEYLSLPTIQSMVPYAFKNYKNFRDNYENGDIIVAESNFGCGSSREQAPAVLKEMGVGAIIAKDFARIFYRNAINLGIVVIECKDVDKIDELDILELELDKGILFNVTKNERYYIEPIPEFMLSILKSGGIINYMRIKSSDL